MKQKHITPLEHNLNLLAKKSTKLKKQGTWLDKRMKKLRQAIEDFKKAFNTC